MVYTREAPRLRQVLVIAARLAQRRALESRSVSNETLQDPITMHRKGLIKLRSGIVNMYLRPVTSCRDNICQRTLAGAHSRACYYIRF
jgi:hypothetical protein